MGTTGSNLQIQQAASFMEEAKRSRALEFRLPSDAGVIMLPFELEGVFDAPVQPNLDYCGQY